MGTEDQTSKHAFGLRVLGMFGVPIDFENEAPGGQEPASEEEAWLTRDLRASGLL